MPRSIRQRCEWIVEQAFNSLVEKIGGGVTRVDNEASLQLQLASVIKTLGELAVTTESERFEIELEKRVSNPNGPFQKSGSNKAKIDIWFRLSDATSDCRIAIELKFFKKENQREPNNRADAFKDIFNLETYTAVADLGYLMVLSDHPHYYNWPKGYSSDTADFDLSHDATYEGGTRLEYRTDKPHVQPFHLSGSYNFQWVPVVDSTRALLLTVEPVR